MLDPRCSGRTGGLIEIKEIFQFTNCLFSSNYRSRKHERNHWVSQLSYSQYWSWNQCEIDWFTRISISVSVPFCNSAALQLNTSAEEFRGGGSELVNKQQTFALNSTLLGKKVSGARQIIIVIKTKNPARPPVIYRITDHMKANNVHQDMDYIRYCRLLDSFYKPLMKFHLPCWIESSYRWDKYCYWWLSWDFPSQLNLSNQLRC